MNHFPDNKEKITCIGGSLDGRELFITSGMRSFKVLGKEGQSEHYVKDGDCFTLINKPVHENPCCQ